MGKTDKDTSLQELKDLVEKFAKDRHWEWHHTPKNLSMNIAIERVVDLDSWCFFRRGRE